MCPIFALIVLNAACTGFTYGLHVANGLITLNLQKILNVGVEAVSKVTDYKIDLPVFYLVLV
ncbi:hypothetical protein GCM10008934_30850 [Virgibacillus salarius]